MKKVFSIIFSTLFIASAAAYASADQNRITSLKVDRSTDRLLVNMTINADDLGRKSNRETLVIPVLSNTDANGVVNSLNLPPVLIAGRNRFYQALRHHTQIPVYRGGKTIPYDANIQWQPWMESAELAVSYRETGCCGSDTLSSLVPLLTLDFKPRSLNVPFPYIRPEAEAVKTRQIKGKAFIDYPVNKTEIYPDYRSNPRELAVIRATIDSVRLDKDITVQSLSLFGFASPEGPFNNNLRLAKGRAEALRNYVLSLYNFNPAVITTAYEAEDWQGLREFLLSSGIENRQLILNLIDGPLSPDAKEEKLKKDFPAQYSFLLNEVFPALRHTDYTINYTVRSYSDPDEILRLVYSRPQNLSLNEFFLAAENVTQGSPEYNYIFETAARMFPDNEIANLNAASAAMQQGALENAARYLAKAGNSPDAIFANGILCTLKGEYQQAREFFQNAARLKVADAPEALKQLDEIIEHNSKISGLFPESNL